MKETVKLLAIGVALVLLTAFSGPSTVDAFADSIVGGGGRCVEENLCPGYCAGDKYWFCADSPIPTDYCTQWAFSPCGSFEDCIKFSFASGSTCPNY